MMLRSIDLATQKKNYVTFDHFEEYFLEWLCLDTSLNPNHHNQVKLVQIPDTHCTFSTQAIEEVVQTFFQLK